MPSATLRRFAAPPLGKGGVLNIDLRSSAADIIGQRAGLIDQRLHLFGTSADIVGGIEHAVHLFKRQGKIGMRRKLLEQVAALAVIHARDRLHRALTDDLVKILTAGAALDALHHQILGRDKGKIFAHRLFDNGRVDDDTGGDLLHEAQYRIGTEEALGQADTAVGGIVERALHPLDGDRHRRVERVRHQIAGERAYALAHHRVALIGHGGGADLRFAERLKELAVVLQKAHIGREFMRGLRDRGQGVENTAVHLAGIGLTLYVEDLVKAESVRDTAVELGDLFAVALEQLLEAGFRAGRAAAAEELDVPQREVDLVEVADKVLQPKSGALADGDELGGLIMGVAEGRHRLILLRKIGEICDDFQ